ncbi:MAG: AAA family ATPase [Oscillospiraceae bacterium]|nr:AAA family ATPase [Oscillospiraceae bacterium]
MNRFRFLTEHCNVNPASVLMLAFNKKAAEELREKMEGLFSTFADREISMPHVMTFHALAYSISFA